MQSYSPSLPNNNSGSPNWISQGAIAIAGSLVLFFTFSILVYFGLVMIYSGRIYPGVNVQGVDLSGLSAEEAETKLSSSITYPNTGLVVLEYEGQQWQFTPGDLGLILDASSTAKAAMEIGRTGFPWERLGEQYSAWLYSAPVSPQLTFDQRAAQAQLEIIANEINQPTIEAKLEVVGTQVNVTPGQIGYTLDIPTTLFILNDQLFTFKDVIVPLPIITAPPQILDVSEQAQIARNILTQPLVLTAKTTTGNESWTLDPTTLASMLTIERVVTSGQADYQVGLNAAKLYNFLAPLAPGLEQASKNARFIFNDDTRKLDLIENAVIGRVLDIDGTINHINASLAEGQHTVDLIFITSEPDITDSTTGQELGIVELVSSQTTYFYGSSTERMQNIQVAASQFHGLFVPPGATFSMAENIGDISLESGYAEALIIYGDRTIAGVGGGVCQVSTTLFRTVFFGGFPVVERYSHAYRVLYYEQTSSGAANSNLAGLDATVYAPIVDFKFQNDTPYWLLMETYVNVGARQITWKFYSTSEGREVEWETTGLENKVDPPDPLYEEDPELPLGAVKQVDWAVEGADVTVNRTVWRNGQILFEDVFRTHYRPWRTICKYGPGTHNFPPEGKVDKYSCKKSTESYNPWMGVFWQ